jgi:nucleotide-binding universal stress UspA family protein
MIAMAAAPPRAAPRAPSRPRRQLVLVDGSLNTELTLAAAITRARRHRTLITLLAVVPDIVGEARRYATLQPGAPVPAQLQELAEAEARRRLSETIRRVPRDIEVATRIRRGDPEREVVAELAEHDYDAVVVAAPALSSS